MTMMDQSFASDQEDQDSWCGFCRNTPGRSSGVPSSTKLLAVACFLLGLLLQFVISVIGVGRFSILGYTQHAMELQEIKGMIKGQQANLILDQIVDHKAISASVIRQDTKMKELENKMNDSFDQKASEVLSQLIDKKVSDAISTSARSQRETMRKELEDTFTNALKTNTAELQSLQTKTDNRLLALESVRIESGEYKAVIPRNQEGIKHYRQIDFQMPFGAVPKVRLVVDSWPLGGFLYCVSNVTRSGFRAELATRGQLDIAVDFFWVATDMPGLLHKIEDYRQEDWQTY